MSAATINEVLRLSNPLEFELKARDVDGNGQWPVNTLVKEDKRGQITWGIIRTRIKSTYITVEARRWLNLMYRISAPPTIITWPILTSTTTFALRVITLCALGKPQRVTEPHRKCKRESSACGELTRKALGRERQAQAGSSMWITTLQTS
ncbi:hypothetical protein HAX54_014674 [Datura stramonium]|uniref:Uncharacterized protein n=1 Tax=Datura stramonium TaxID=4076 RepID=A0ABS8TRA4_DATST|nr:hypothetical protein [Datura stramonium]